MLVQSEDRDQLSSKVLSLATSFTKPLSYVAFQFHSFIYSFKLTHSFVIRRPEAVMNRKGVMILVNLRVFVSLWLEVFYSERRIHASRMRTEFE